MDRYTDSSCSPKIVRHELQLVGKKGFPKDARNPWRPLRD